MIHYGPFTSVIYETGDRDEEKEKQKSANLTKMNHQMG
jgi:hypothetical protein